MLCIHNNTQKQGTQLEDVAVRFPPSTCLSVCCCFIYLRRSICWILPFYATRALFVVAVAVGTLPDDGVEEENAKIPRDRLKTHYARYFVCGGRERSKLVGKKNQ